MDEMSGSDREALERLVGAYAQEPGGLLPALTALQETYGYISEAAVPVLADIFNLSRAEVHGTISFYHDYRRQPPGRIVVRICQAEACQAMGSRTLTQHAVKSLGIGLNETDSSADVTLEPVYCLGNCALSPAIMIGERVHGRVDAAKFDRILRNAGLDDR